MKDYITINGVKHNVITINKINKDGVNEPYDIYEPTEHTCENEYCRRYYYTEYNNNFCSDECRENN